MKAWLSRIHPTTQKFVAALTGIVAMVAAFNWLNPTQASSITALVIAVAAFESDRLLTDMVIGAVNAPITGTPTAVWAAL